MFNKEKSDERKVTEEKQIEAPLVGKPEGGKLSNEAIAKKILDEFGVDCTAGIGNRQWLITEYKRLRYEGGEQSTQRDEQVSEAPGEPVDVDSEDNEEESTE